MRKLALFVGILVSSIAGVLHSEDYGYGKVSWRSSETATADTLVWIATSAIYLKEVVVASGDVNSNFQYFNSSDPTTNVVISTSIPYQTSVTGSVFPINDVLWGGLGYNKSGSAKIVIHWDFLNNAPPSQRFRGLK